MIYVGHISSTHGIKGELKCYTNFSRPDLVYKLHQKVYIDGVEHVISSIRFHQNHYLVTFDSLNDINLVENFRNQDVYIKRNHLDLKEKEYLIEELLRFSVFENQNYLGEIVDIVYNKGGNLLNVKGKSSFYIPFQDYFIKDVNIQEKKVVVENTKGLW